MPVWPSWSSTTRSSSGWTRWATPSGIELRFALGPTARRITYRFTKDGRIILLTTFRKQRNNERNEIDRARKAAEDCAKQYP